MEDLTLSMSRPWQGDGPELRTWGSFELLERVGRGGFGEVYRAFDPALQREVAVKLLLPDEAVGDDQGGAILREARAMARVIHPNVVPIYGVGVYDGRAGFWSAFIHGKTLAALLAANGPFGPGEVIRIGIDLCRALSAVHAAGLLHRDIKAGNVMREAGGRIVLMDFGLTHHSGENNLQGGTPGYLAPDLRAGARASVGSDLYALGVLLYYLLSGKYPTEDADAMSDLMGHRSDLPPSLARIVHTAMNPEPRKQFASAAQMAAALADCGSEPGGSAGQPALPRLAARRRYAIAALAICVLLASAYALRSMWLPAASRVMPAGVHRNYLRAHDLVRHYYRPNALPTAIPILENVVRDDPHFAAAFADLGRANFVEFWELRDTKFVEPARKASLDALAIDANQASAHVTLAMLYTQLGENGIAAQEMDAALRIDRMDAEAWGARAELYRRQGRTDEVEPALRKAMDLEPSDWRWPKQLGDYFSHAGRPDLAILADRDAVRLAPDNAAAYNNLGLALWSAGRLPESRAALEKAIALEPGYNRYSNLGLVQRDLGDYAAAASLFKRAIALNRGDYRAWGLLADIYRRRGDNPAQTRETYRKSIALGEELLRTKPRETSLLSDLGMMYAAIGDSERSVPLVRQAAALEPENGEVLFMAGVALEAVHRRADAIEFIASALRHGYSKTSVERLPELASLRADKNYLAMASSLR